MCFFRLSFFFSHCFKHHSFRHWERQFCSRISCVFFSSFRSISFSRIFFTYFLSVSFVLALGLVRITFLSSSSSSVCFIFLFRHFFRRCCYQYWLGIILPIIRGSEMGGERTVHPDPETDNESYIDSGTVEAVAVGIDKRERPKETTDTAATGDGGVFWVRIRRPLLSLFFSSKNKVKLCERVCASFFYCFTLAAAVNEC